MAALDATTASSSAEPLWTPPAPTRTVPYSLITDIVEINVFAATGGPTLAGAVELVSPANKDRPAHRDAFVSKCASYLQQGVGLVIVDVVTERGGNLHAALLDRLQVSSESPFEAALYATAYRPNGHNGQPQLNIWQEALAIARSLPTLPLSLRGGVSVPVELEASYERTCREPRVLANGKQLNTNPKCICPLFPLQFFYSYTHGSIARKGRASSFRLSEPLQSRGNKITLGFAAVRKFPHAVGSHKSACFSKCASRYLSSCRNRTGRIILRCSRARPRLD